MGAGDLADDVEAKAEPGTALLASLERFEYPADPVGGNRIAVIPHVHLDLTPQPSGTNANPSLAILDRVREQVRETLVDTLPIPSPSEITVELHADGAFRTLRPDLVDQIATECAEVHLHRLDRQTTGSDAGEVQQISSHAVHSLGRAEDSIRDLAVSLGRWVATLQRLGTRRDGGERGAEVVR